MVPQGGLIFGVLVYGSTADKPANKGQLDSWITSIATPNSWALDSEAPQKPLTDFFATSHDEFVLIDLKTMKIVEFFSGNARAALARLGELLAE